ncbi:G-type lectin S-receptor-like serine/threonine-protein kinase LECRK3 isoform X1 [Vitis vinifera]|uniref:Receptor-like serine/threonine-protein kinase n=3 Tax=Vitis vinifera TaxID=29760 RepID=A0A438IAI1_VITVI|nr:G-type lectin S-receptor-like serine/threonine-protein kinase LECRK3 isoform X1 [Vitis vinifera]RVW93669.1 G-type lectin S-receptor-like serine/threonine-protein kinase LECRK3 [Vitis vinifera]|eukprot:XP_002268770.1 PREDICTED: G-type lectin S-receptor-like serine/threonine-protein kinase LECRK3 [Vitis vinifera]
MAARFFLLLVLPSLVLSQYCTDLDITASQDSPRCVSPSGEFAFGFYRLGSQSLFLLAIWFENIPEKTLVWYANGDNPAPKGSKLELTSDGQFILSDPQGKEIWRPQNSVTAVTHAAMLDTGNFVLENRNQNLTVWQSFQNPANTILPTQTLEIGGTMYSQQSNSSYSKGRFQLQMKAGGNLVLNTLDPESGKAYDVYYSIYTSDAANSSNSGLRLIFDESGGIYVLLRNGGTVNITSGSSLTGDYYYRATLDQDGVFRLYNRDNSSTSWSVVKNIPDNICTVTPSNLGSGICGFNSYCSIDGRGLPDCLCPDGYSHLDPLDRKQGCKPNFELPSCQTAVDGWEADKDAVDFRELKDVNWPLSDYQLQEGPEFNKEKCKQSCKDDCLCVVAIYNTENQCWKKKFPLSNGRHEPTQNVLQYTTALIKVRIKNDTIERCPDKSTLILVGSVLLGSSVFFNLFLLLAIPAAALFFYNKKLMNIQSVSSKFPTTSVRTYSYKELEEATGGFKEKLGRGAFGTVYKGVLASDAGRFVAVKKLDKVVQEGEKEFKTEVTVIGQTHHRNLVSLLGYCDQGVHRLLVYEYMNNGSLADLLFGISTPDWSQRLQIAFKIAKGLMYLHEECSTPIIHCDIKPENILLDEYLTPRISDFGLAKLLIRDHTRTLTTIRGTKGYVAPEWFRSKPITAKVDVYSYGVMLLEIISCRKSVHSQPENEEEAILADWAYDCYRGHRLDKLVKNDDEAGKDMGMLERVVMVAIWCIQEDPSLRPSMGMVILMLQGVVEVPVPPCPFPFSSTF